MTEPVDVQAERLRELAADARGGPWTIRPHTPPESKGFLRYDIRSGASGLSGGSPVARIWAKEDAAFIAACDPQTVLALTDLLAGQAEQIERLERQNHDLDFRLEAEKSSHRTDNRELVRQRDNLRDAAIQARRDLWWFIETFSEGAEFNDTDQEIVSRAMSIQDDVLGVALRAAAVGEDTE